MNEQAGKALTGFVDALKTQPLSLALVAMNVLLIAYLFFNESKYIQGRQRLADQIFQHAQKTADLLAKCVAVDELHKLMERLQVIPR